MTNHCPITPFPRWVPLWFIRLDDWLRARLGLSMRCALPLSLMAMALASLVLTSCSTASVDAGSTTGETQGIVKPAGAVSTQTLELIAPADRDRAPALCGMPVDAPADGKANELCLPKETVTIINFWGSWCPPCLREMPDLMAIQADYPDVMLLGINSNDTQVNARQFQKEHAITFPSLYDDGGVLAVQFGDMAPEVMPSTLLIDKHGKIALRIVGAVTKDRLEPLVQQLVAE